MSLDCWSSREMIDGVHGLLLAAGAGRRAGGPKALRHDADGTSWLRRSVGVLRDGGCDPVTVVLGAGAESARSLLDPQTPVVEAADWVEGMGASLRAGLTAVDSTDADAVLLHLVDLPDVTAAVVDRVRKAVRGPGTLARASYDGVPGHPVVLGRDHWAGVTAGASGDRGARDYLASRRVLLVDCSDLATGADVDAPEGGAPTGAHPPPRG